MSYTRKDLFDSRLLLQHAFWWRRLDSNQRRRKPTDLQSAPFSHSGTPPQRTDDYEGTTACCQGLPDRSKLIALTYMVAPTPPQTQKPHLFGWGFCLLLGSLTITYFHPGIRTIIGVESFHGPVRDGKGWDRLAMVIRHDLLSCRLCGRHNQSGRSSFW